MIGKARQERLWNHLLELEKQTGMPLRKTPRYYWSNKMCPIVQFAPDNNKDCHEYMFNNDTKVFYEKHIYKIYSKEDSLWWAELTEETQRRTIAWLKSKIKEHLK